MSWKHPTPFPRGLHITRLHFWGSWAGTMVVNPRRWWIWSLVPFLDCDAYFGCSTQTSETCKYLNDSPERSASPAGVCISPRDECLSDAVAIELLRACAQIGPSPPPAPFLTSPTKWSDHNHVVRSSKRVIRWNAIKLKSVWMYCLFRKKQGFSLILKKNVITMYVHAY